MTLKTEYKALTAIAALFCLFYFVPLAFTGGWGSAGEALRLAQWYAREHVLTCLIPAFFIAGAIAVFVSKASVMRYLGAGANKVVAYSVASVSGSILAVCSCTVLPLFAGIYRMGAGLGPATAFLYSGPAINVLAIVLTARVLGFELGVARAVGAVLFAVLIGLIMQLIFRREEEEKVQAQAQLPVPDAPRPLWQTALYFVAMVAILVFVNWANPGEGASGFFAAVFQEKWVLTAVFATALGLMLAAWFGLKWWKILLIAGHTLMLIYVFGTSAYLAFVAAELIFIVALLRSGGELLEWLKESWALAKQIIPLLFIGVLVAGLLLGTPGSRGLIPPAWIAWALGGNSLWANLFAAVAGAFMYFATLTEVPIVEGLMAGGMGKGPALALLLAGPALSLPNMLVIAKVMGWKKTGVFVGLVVVMATISGLVFGQLFG
ncbi:permease [bacterium]|nr:permease [bacterium]